jgi:glycine cleavage system H protein
VIGIGWMLNFPLAFKYSTHHIWAMIENDVATVGMTDFAQYCLSAIVYVEVPAIHSECREGDPIGVIESVINYFDFVCPLSGIIVESNKLLEAKPKLLNEDPYGKGWFFKIRMSNVSEVDTLFSAEEYVNLIEIETEETEEQKPKTSTGKPRLDHFFNYPALHGKIMAEARKRNIDRMMLLDRVIALEKSGLNPYECLERALKDIDRKHS